MFKSSMSKTFISVLIVAVVLGAAYIVYNQVFKSSEEKDFLNFQNSEDLVVYEPKSFKLTIVKEKADPYGAPRPENGAVDVPLKTSYFIKLQNNSSDKQDMIQPDSVSVRLKPEGGEEFYILKTGQRYAPGYSGSIIQKENTIEIFVDTAKELKPLTKYEITVTAMSVKGEGISTNAGKWSFTTADKKTAYRIGYSLDLKAVNVIKWQGRYFTGLLTPNENASNARYDFLNTVKDEYPQAWDLIRGYNMTGFEHNEVKLIPNKHANIVRELETRRIKGMKQQNDGVLLEVEDFFGHEYYGIESGRPLSGDYNAGDEILIADGVNSVRAFVISVDDVNNTVLVSKFNNPAGGWVINYPRPNAVTEDPNNPGFFPTGGTYLRKFNPVGTPMYNWTRFDYRYDTMHKKYGYRMVVGITDAPGDLSIDGQSWTRPKNYAQFHEVIYTATCHLIDRYGDETLNWVWSILNEPDLPRTFWRVNDWKELQKFYDYASDAVLRAFEDKGYDSEKVFIGGLELGGISGTNLKLDDFLIHCSPVAKLKSGVVEKNAAYADEKLDGKRSRRVEELCSAHNGRGAPIDFISIHTYNGSDMAADKLIKAKETALIIDENYYEDLWINNFESVPSWHVITDPGAADTYRGNGYFPVWCSNLLGRLLHKADQDPRYAYGDSVLTVWPFTASNFGTLNDVVREISIDDNGDNIPDRKEVIAKPIFNFMNLLSTMETNYFVLPDNKAGSHKISGFGSKTDDDIRLLLYAYDEKDTHCRSENEFNIELDLNGLDWNRIEVIQYRFDKENNSYYDLAKEYQYRNYITKKEFDEVKEKSLLKVTASSTQSTGKDGSLKLNVKIGANGANFIILKKK